MDFRKYIIDSINAYKQSKNLDVDTTSYLNVCIKEIENATTLNDIENKYVKLYNHLYNTDGLPSLKEVAAKKKETIDKIKDEVKKYQSVINNIEDILMTTSLPYKREIKNLLVGLKDAMPDKNSEMSIKQKRDFEKAYKDIVKYTKKHKLENKFNLPDEPFGQAKKPYDFKRYQKVIDKIQRDVLTNDVYNIGHDDKNTIRSLLESMKSSKTEAEFNSFFDMFKTRLKSINGETLPSEFDINIPLLKETYTPAEFLQNKDDVLRQVPADRRDEVKGKIETIETQIKNNRDPEQVYSDLFDYMETNDIFCMSKRDKAPRKSFLPWKKHNTGARREELARKNIFGRRKKNKSKSRNKAYPPVKDISTTSKPEDVIEVLIKLNPEISISIHDMTYYAEKENYGSLVKKAKSEIFLPDGVELSNLTLPKGFVIEDNTITNSGAGLKASGGVPVRITSKATSKAADGEILYSYYVDFNDEAKGLINEIRSDLNGAQTQEEFDIIVKSYKEKIENLPQSVNPQNSLIILNALNDLLKYSSFHLEKDSFVKEIDDINISKSTNQKPVLVDWIRDVSEAFKNAKNTEDIKKIQELKKKEIEKLRSYGLTDDEVDIFKMKLKEEAETAGINVFNKWLEDISTRITNAKSVKDIEIIKDTLDDKPLIISIAGTVPYNVIQEKKDGMLVKASKKEGQIKFNNWSDEQKRKIEAAKTTDEVQNIINNININEINDQFESFVTSAFITIEIDELNDLANNKIANITFKSFLDDIKRKIEDAKTDDDIEEIYKFISSELDKTKTFKNLSQEQIDSEISKCYSSLNEKALEIRIEVILTIFEKDNIDTYDKYVEALSKIQKTCSENPDILSGFMPKLYKRIGEYFSSGNLLINSIIDDIKSQITKEIEETTTEDDLNEKVGIIKEEINDKINNLFHDSGGDTYKGELLKHLKEKANETKESFNKSQTDFINQSPSESGKSDEFEDEMNSFLEYMDNVNDKQKDKPQHNKKRK